METTRAQPATLDDVIAKLRELATDLEDHPDEWENPTLPRYLEAMTAWLQSVRARGFEEPSWRLILTAFEAARIYE